MRTCRPERLKAFDYIGPHAYFLTYCTNQRHEAFIDHVLRDDESVLSVARYILENPVRAGITKSVCEYPFTGSPLHSVEEILDSLPWRPRSA